MKLLLFQKDIIKFNMNATQIQCSQYSLQVHHYPDQDKPLSTEMKEW